MDRGEDERDRVSIEEERISDHYMVSIDKVITTALLLPLPAFTPALPPTNN